jgi:hypothetical protein
MFIKKGEDILSGFSLSKFLLPQFRLSHKKSMMGGRGDFLSSFANDLKKWRGYSKWF